ncbi:AMP-binding protein [Geodermatophilus sp. CPCC 206100]|uniref:AMP-binding protein n=1 Tax=Geodermatophilus sp. CPCC 206100 TaxID=3020054 RepID=UPI003AFFF4A3
MIIRSRFPAVPIPDQTLPAFLLDRAAELGDAPALVDGATGRVTSYAELDESVHRAAAGFAAAGTARGDVVALMAPNCPDWAVALLGAQAAGAAVTPINPLAPPEQVLVQLQDSGARCLVTVPALLDRVGVAADKAGVTDLVVLGEAPGARSFAELLDAERGRTVAGNPADVALLPYSSGTTGLPKGVRLTHRSLVASCAQTEPLFAYAPTDTTVAVLPWWHAAGFATQLVHPLHEGATTVTMPRFDLPEFLGLLTRHRVAKQIVVPPIVLALAKHPAVDDADLSALEVLGSGAAPLGAGLEQACAARLGCVVLQGYGMTETGPMLAIAPLSGGHVRPPGSAGMLVAGTEARLVDPISGQDAETGELWVRGAQVMAGYLNEPAATAATLDAEGWMRTGDLATVDADGWVFLLDRVKELIKYKGHQVAPAALEAVLITHPAVADAAVVGVPDEEAGELPRAFVVRSGTVSEEELIEYVADRVAPQEKVRDVVFTDTVPRSPTGKVLRRLLK